jgi:hypothetical protein
MILALLLSATAAAAATPETLGRELAAAAKRGGAANVAVEPFETPRGAPIGLGRDAADALLRGIVDSGRVRAVERERLPALMSERRLSASGAVAGTAEAPRVSAGDAVVVGGLARVAGGWSLTARVVVVASGEVLGAGQADLSDADYADAGTRAAVETEDFPPLDRLIEGAHALATTAGERELDRKAREGDASARAMAVLALAEKDRSDDFALADALRDGDALVRLAATMVLGRVPQSWAEGPLRRVLRDDPSWLARFGAAQALVRYRTDESEKDLAAARTADPSWRVRQQAADSLAARGQSAP